MRHRLILGDCSDELASIDTDGLAVVTDPPYGIRADEKNSKPPNDPNGWRHYGEQTGWDRERCPDLIAAVLKLNVPTIIWGGNYYTDVLPPSMGWLIWDKGQSDFSLADVEMAWWSEWKAARRMVYPRAVALKENGLHPTQKPVTVMRWCIEHLPKDVTTILDPFMGSGTTGVAALQLGRRFIGIERDARYFEVAKRRIESARFGTRPLRSKRVDAGGPLL